ncbi:hypothetical protein DFH07DRAFT_962140 [Mycena maculata]|uniref:Uncharacterized protein n=1 Tax=Mycena maculata TaxID=230809 RepID=A0AAD7IQT0_9AGAR|nr:hypothetical protein DFH07DRAFT_962140 [Mycena maculata]
MDFGGMSAPARVQSNYEVPTNTLQLTMWFDWPAPPPRPTRDASQVTALKIVNAGYGRSPPATSLLLPCLSTLPAAPFPFASTSALLLLPCRGGVEVSLGRERGDIARARSPAVRALSSFAICVGTWTIHCVSRAERSRTLLDVSLPGDIPLQIFTLQKYVKLSHDIVGALAPPDAMHVLLRIPILLGSRALPAHLMDGDPHPLTPPASPDGWLPLYRAPQALSFLTPTHTTVTTMLLLRNRRLITGSYDGTNRFLDVPTGELLRCLEVGKPVSCVDYLAGEICCGSWFTTGPMFTLAYGIYSFP